MQATPPSSIAARIASTSLPASSRMPFPAASHTHVLPINPPDSLSALTHTLADTIGLAHDAGNFLAALSLYCDLLSVPGVLRLEHKHYAAELCLISNRSSNLIRRLLSGPLAPTTDSLQTRSSVPLPVAAPSRRSTRPLDTATTSHNHSSILHNLTPVLQRIAAGAANVSVTCPASLPPLDFPPEILERITVNLVRNAAEAIRIQRRNTYSAALPHCGEIHVSLAIAGPELHLTVEDNGPGMPPSVAAVFLHPAPLPQGANRGLGHRIVHDLAAASDGQLAIRVLPGNGTVFSLKWPIPIAMSD